MASSLDLRPTDSPVMTLSTAEGFVVMSLRLWLAALREPAAATPDWLDGFRRARLGSSAACCFDMLVRLMLGLNRQALDIRWQCCSRLGSDEALFLHALALMQAKRNGEAYALLHDWLRPCAARVAAGLCEQFADALSAAGLLLPGCACDDDPRHDMTPSRREHGARVLH
jgi:hypothetical protein